MNLTLEDGPRPERENTKEYAWNALNIPLILKVADDLGAMFEVVDGSGDTWYLNLNTMKYRPLAAADLAKNRPEVAEHYPIQEQHFANGAEAAMAVRGYHLIEKMKSLKAAVSPEIAEIVKHVITPLDKENTQYILDGLKEELNLIRAYLKETEPKERMRIEKDLQEIYKEMQENTLEEDPTTTA